MSEDELNRLRAQSDDKAIAIAREFDRRAKEISTLREQLADAEKERDDQKRAADRFQQLFTQWNHRCLEAEKKASRLVEAIRPLFSNAMFAMKAMATWSDDDPRWEMDDDEADADMDRSEQNWLTLEEVLKEFGVEWNGEKG